MFTQRRLKRLHFSFHPCLLHYRINPALSASISSLCYRYPKCAQAHPSATEPRSCRSLFTIAGPTVSAFFRIGFMYWERNTRRPCSHEALVRLFLPASPSALFFSTTIQYTLQSYCGRLEEPGPPRTKAIPGARYTTAAAVYILGSLLSDALLFRWVRRILLRELHEARKAAMREPHGCNHSTCRVRA
ncbi:hypothetical protein P171DRAFT_285161 [Karstenula rhodostoma CBS 690.94]|uniref:Uncharacterized protein n=1 Tax=Karstenula rhodostoma CBS 690.94 TaxID=1392251 RepID=A0A9P4PIY2_9PLEO|nr:hypothetical protein P171DRAFT_285161 [Karstenula rhodostoma CBS 690.94]